MKERIQKILASAGICSRRAAETYISEGRIQVNGLPAKLGDQADAQTDSITLDGEVLQLQQETYRYIMLHKPVGVVSTMADEQGRPSVRELTKDVGARVYPVGRLDLNSSGLLLMTNDGDLAYRLTHPKFEVKKTYLVSVCGNVVEALTQLRAPMELDGVLLRPAAVSLIKTTPESAVLEVVIHEGKNRQIRRMCEKAALSVAWLRRVAEGTLQLGALEKGTWRDLTAEEIAYLKSV